MCFVHKLTLLAMLALVATALAASTALAQTEPLLHNQSPQMIAQAEVHGAPDTLCPVVMPTPPTAASPTVTSGGCRMHFSSIGLVSLSVHLSAGGPEVLVGTCNVEFDVRLDAAAEGRITHQEFTGDPSSCTRRACGQATPPTGEGRAYSFFMRETEPEPSELGTGLFCTEPIGQTAPTHCEVTLPASAPVRHQARLEAVDVAGHGAAFPRCEMTGTFDSEASLGTSGEGQLYQKVEVRHG
jgi:hypothetical protein